MSIAEQLAENYTQTAEFWYARATEAITTEDEEYAHREAAAAELMAADILAGENQ